MSGPSWTHHNLGRRISFAESPQGVLIYPRDDATLFDNALIDYRDGVKVRRAVDVVAGNCYWSNGLEGDDQVILSWDGPWGFQIGPQPLVRSIAYAAGRPAHVKMMYEHLNYRPVYQPKTATETDGYKSVTFERWTPHIYDGGSIVNSAPKPILGVGLIAGTLIAVCSVHGPDNMASFSFAEVFYFLGSQWLSAGTIDIPASLTTDPYEIVKPFNVFSFNKSGDKAASVGFLLKTAITGMPSDAEEALAMDIYRQDSGLTGIYDTNQFISPHTDVVPMHLRGAYLESFIIRLDMHKDSEGVITFDQSFDRQTIRVDQAISASFSSVAPYMGSGSMLNTFTGNDGMSYVAIGYSGDEEIVYSGKQITWEESRSTESTINVSPASSYSTNFIYERSARIELYKNATATGIYLFYEESRGGLSGTGINDRISGDYEETRATTADLYFYQTSLSFLDITNDVHVLLKRSTTNETDLLFSRDGNSELVDFTSSGNFKVSHAISSPNYVLPLTHDQTPNITGLGGGTPLFADPFATSADVSLSEYFSNHFDLGTCGSNPIYTRNYYADSGSSLAVIFPTHRPALTSEATEYFNNHCLAAYSDTSGLTLSLQVDGYQPGSIPTYFVSEIENRLYGGTIEGLLGHAEADGFRLSFPGKAKGIGLIASPFLLTNDRHLQLAREINIRRVENGGTPLIIVRRGAVFDAAMAHSEYCAVITQSANHDNAAARLTILSEQYNGFVADGGLGGTGSGAEYSDYPGLPDGSLFSAYGENVNAYPSYSKIAFADYWQASSEHWSAITDPNYTHTTLAIYIDPESGWAGATQIFWRYY